MIKVYPIHTKKEFRQFVAFKTALYKGNPYAVPSLVMDELATLDRKKNPASEFCDFQCFLARDPNGKIVGRIAAIINHRANEAWNKREGRFGFFDFVEDFEVARALLSVAEAWVAERGMTAIHGPLGFTDMDQEGLLVEGYDQLGTMVSLYNYPYYVDFIERLGYVKDADWVEYRFNIPDQIPERVVKFAKIVSEKLDVHVVRFSSGRQLARDGWGTKIFELINVAYKDLYGFSAMTQRQIEHYVRMYLPLMRMELISLIADRDDNLVAFGISMPSLSRALQRSGGRMFPLGWFHLLRALKRRRIEEVDLMLIAVDPAYQNKGLTAILMNQIIGGMQRIGAQWSESNPELETNEAMRNQWEMFERRQHKRRRAYLKHLVALEAPSPQPSPKP